MFIILSWKMWISFYEFQTLWCRFCQRRFLFILKSSNSLMLLTSLSLLNKLQLFYHGFFFYFENFNISHCLLLRPHLPRRLWPPPYWRWLQITLPPPLSPLQTAGVWRHGHLCPPHLVTWQRSTERSAGGAELHSRVLHSSQHKGQTLFLFCLNQ